MKSSILVAWCLVFGLFFSQEVKAFCLFNCDPSESNAKAVFTNVFLKKKSPNTSYVISEFKKTNGIKRKIFGQEIYEFSFKAKVKFPSGADHECYYLSSNFRGTKEEKARQMMKFQSCYIRGISGVHPGGSLSFSRVYVFEKTERGWLGQDGVLY